MARGNRITITITPHGNHQTVAIRTTGSNGSVNYNTTTADKIGVPRIEATTSNSYWNQQVTQALAYIPAS